MSPQDDGPDDAAADEPTAAEGPNGAPADDEPGAEPADDGSDGDGPEADRDRDAGAGDDVEASDDAGDDATGAETGPGTADEPSSATTAEEFDPDTGGDQQYCHACGAAIDPAANFCPECGADQTDAGGGAGQTAGGAGTGSGGGSQKDRVTAGVFAILLGSFGVHHFYLGNIGLGVLYLCFFWTGLPGLVGIVEGILYLTKTDEEFQRRYVDED